MIVVRSPLRITLGCGGTDRLPYCQEHGGLSITAAIDKYVYVTVMRPFDEAINLKYSKLEKVATVAEVQHTIIRECLKMMNVTSKVEITTLADIPGGTGLGSSSSLTTAALLALATFTHKTVDPLLLAMMACAIEIDRLKAPIGKQDQYASAYGGLTRLTFRKDGGVDAVAACIPDKAVVDLEENLMLFFTGYIRNTNDVSKATMDQGLLDWSKAITSQMITALSRGEVYHWAELMHAYWLEKRKVASNEQIDSLYTTAMSRGAVGGKLVGAGGGGFLMFYAEDKRRLRMALDACGLQEVRFRFDWEGTKVVVQ